MHAIELGHGSHRRWCLVFETGEEVMEGLRDFVLRHDVRGAHFSALGAFREATLAYFHWETKEYEDIPVEEQVEVTSLVGDVGLGDEGIVIHAHCVLGRRDGSAVTGHLTAGTVRPTLELFLDEGSHELRRRLDEESGLALIRPGLTP